MANGVQSFIASFRRIYEAATGNLKDRQLLNVYYAHGTEQILIIRIRPIGGNDAILMLDGIDPYGDNCTLITHVAPLSLLMKIREEKEETKVYERERIGFDLRSFE